MHGNAPRPGGLDRSEPHDSQRHGVPPYLVFFGIPPFLAAFVVTALDPMGGVALLACLTVMVIVLNVLQRYAMR
jgi:hypothetical protein